MTITGLPAGVTFTGGAGSTSTGWYHSTSDGGYVQFSRMTGAEVGTYYPPPPTPAGSFAPPASSTAATHLQFSASTIGSPAFLSYGRSDLPGQIIWAAGIDASSSALDTSLLTFAACYGEPIDPDVPMKIQTMSCNGTLFYDDSAGGIITVANITAGDQASLNSCIANMAVYHGTETQLPDPTMETYLGVGNVPAYRGLRYIVLIDFPLILAGNSVPNIIVEWRPVSGGLINVSDAMIALITHINLRSEPKPLFGTPTVIGVDDQCYGLVENSQGSLLDHFVNHRNIYNYQIVEADPISIVRKAVGADLVIDLSVAEDDCLGDGGVGPVVIFNRANPTDFPVGVNLSYTDPDGNYDVKVAPATFDGSPPGNGNAGSSAILSAQSSYIVDATTARSLAFTMMFALRSFAGRASFMIGDLRPEVGDIIELTTDVGDIFILLVNTQTFTKTRSNVIDAMVLLTQAGSGVDGDAGRNGGSAARQRWPQDVLLADFVVTPDHFYTALEFDHIFSVNTNPSPLLKIGTSKWRDMEAADLTGANWGASDFGVYPGNMFEDDNFVYWLSYGYLIFSRLSKTASLISQIETWTIPAGFADGLETNFNRPGTYGFTFKDGKLYIPWQGGFNGSLFADPDKDIKLVVVDMGAWGDQTSAAWEIHDVHLYTSGTYYGPIACCVLDNGVVVMPSADFNGFGTTTRFYTSTLGALGTWTSVDNSSGFRPDYTETMVHSGNVIYAKEWFSTGGIANESHRIALWDFTSGLSETLVDLRDDPNVVGLAQVRGWEWRSDTHFFVYCNHVNYSNSDFPANAPRRYIARRKLSDGTSAGGAFLDQVMWNGFDFEVFRGRFFNGKNYLHMDIFARGNTRLVEISEDLDPATATHWWPQQAATPANNAFANAVLLTLGRVAQVDMRYCSTESGEDYPPWAVPATGSGNDPYTYHNGHSLWFKYVASATATRTITVSSVLSTIKRIDPGVEYGVLYGLVVWTGSALGALTPIAHYTPLSGAAPPSANTLTFSAVSGTTYHISIYAYAGYNSGFAGVFTDDVFGGGFDLDLQFFGITTLALT